MGVPNTHTMCFTQEMSGAFSLLGLIFALWVSKTNGNSNIIKGVLYFVAMETLQFVQYSFIATDVDPAEPTLEQFAASPTCQSNANRFLTLLGLLHICFQPYYSAHLSCAFVTSDKNVAQFELVKRLQLVGGVFLLGRYFFTLVDVAAWGMDPRYGFDAHRWSAKTSVEWLDGPMLCTYKGLQHLAWSVPLAPVSYYMPSMGLHSFLMFIPFFVLDHGSLSRNIPNWIAGAILFLSGPAMADWFTPNKHEAASIWCFFSICQVLGLVAILFSTMHSRGRWFVSNTEKTVKTN